MKVQRRRFVLEDYMLSASITMLAGILVEVVHLPASWVGGFGVGLAYVFGHARGSGRTVTAYREPPPGAVDLVPPAPDAPTTRLEARA